MTRNLKAFGLALCAALALCAVAASGASADLFKSDASQGGKTWLTAEQKTDGNTKNIHGENLAGYQEFQFTTADTNKVLKCEEVSAKANFEGPGTETLTYTNVKYEKCNNWITNEAGETERSTVLHVNFTECDYVFGTTTTPNPGKPAGKYGEGEHAAMQIKCPVGQEIHTKATNFELECATTPEQTVHGVKYFNGETEGIEDVSIHATVHGIESTTQGVCGEGVHTDGTWTGEITVTGFNNEAQTNKTSVTIEGAGLT